MVAVPVFNPEGKRTGEMEIDPALLGGEVRAELMKQAVVAYLDHQRQRSARTKGRSQVEGSTRKLYRQKGTGNARMGSIRTVIRRGGGVAFAKRGPGAPKGLPKKMRRAARNSAILAKLEAQEVLIVDGWQCPEPKTKNFVSLVKALEVEQGCLLAVDQYDRQVYLSGRNVPGTDVRVLDELTTYEILRRKKLVFTKPAFERLGQELANSGGAASA